MRLDQEFHRAERKAMEKGMAEGLAKGMAEGAREQSIKVAEKLLIKGLSGAEIAEITGLTLKDIENLKKV